MTRRKCKLIQEGFYLLGYNAVQFAESQPPPSSGLKNEPSSAWYQRHARLFFGFFFDLEDLCNMLLQNIGWLSPDYTALQNIGLLKMIIYFCTKINYPTEVQNLC
jgi:hypothetical protein